MLNKIEYEQQKLIAKFINKISKINKMSICLTNNSILLLI